MINKILIPSRLFTDTSIALFLLHKFGGEKFANIKNANIEIQAILPEGETEETLNTKGVLLLDIGGGIFDHHNKDTKTTSSALVASVLSIDDRPSIIKLLAFAERCDFYGQGIISNDMLDKAFGFPGLLISLNQKFDNDPNKVFPILYELLDAHLATEINKTEELPNEVAEKKKSGDFISFSVIQRGRKLNVAFITSNDSVMSSFLRSKVGGGFDVTVVWRTTGHVNIITKQSVKVDLRSLTAVVRKSEAMVVGTNLSDMNELASYGRVDAVPQWFFDTATNTLQNGGINPTKNILPTKISRESFIELIKIGLSESLWKPE